MKLIDIINDIAEGKIKEKEIKLGYGAGYYTYYVEEDKIINDTNGTGLYINKCLNDEFEILESVEQDIDIQSIEELKTIDYILKGDENNTRDFIKRTNKVIVDNFYTVNGVIKNQNKLIRAVKQLDRKIREER